MKVLTLASMALDASMSHAPTVTTNQDLLRVEMEELELSESDSNRESELEESEQYNG